MLCFTIIRRFGQKAVHQLRQVCVGNFCKFVIRKKEILEIKLFCLLILPSQMCMGLLHSVGLVGSYLLANILGLIVSGVSGSSAHPFTIHTRTYSVSRKMRFFQFYLSQNLAIQKSPSIIPRFTTLLTYQSTQLKANSCQARPRGYR